MSSDIDLAEARVVAVAAAEAAGRLVRERFSGPAAVSAKGSVGDVVTDLDLACEALIVKTLRSAYPQHRVISEEAGVIVGDAAWTWLVDPVDGTNNLVVGLPVLAVGVTLCHDDVAEVGAVHEPLSGRTWSAVRGVGAWDGTGRRLEDGAGPIPGRTKPTFAVLQGYGVGSADPTAQALRLLLSRAAYRVLDLWSPLTCWSMLARGDIDGIVGYRIGELDLLGGALIAREAGMAVCDFAGRPFDARLDGTDDRRVLASRPEFQDLLLGLVRDAAAVGADLAPLLSRPVPRPA